jgi:glycine/D-amino acid oxidase-like deaminating enzyme
MLPAPPPARRLVSAERADCAVVGAGFTGLATARALAARRPDWRVVVLEAQRVGYGASGRNSGFVVDVGHWDPRLGPEGNRRLVRLARGGLEDLRTLVRAHAMECAWTEGGCLHGAVEDVGLHALETFCRGLDAMGEPWEPLDAAALAAVTGTTYYKGGARTPGAVTVQPAALVRGLAASLPAGVDLFEESPVRSIDRAAGFRLEAGEGTVVADRLFLATDGFTASLGFLARRIFPLFTFASLTRVLTPAERVALGGAPAWGLVPEERMGTTVRRTSDHRILVRNTVRWAAGLRVSDALRGRVRAIHERAFRSRFPVLADVDLEHTWSGVMGMSLNGAPFFGRLDEHLYAAAGWNGVGVAMGTVSGRLLADLAVGVESDLLRDVQALPGPAWLPPEPLLGVGVRATLVRLQARAGAER